ncbi:MAG: LysM peptidoglycan-binding domain-containing protein, partial [Chromatiales bacterium]
SLRETAAQAEAEAAERARRLNELQASLTSLKAEREQLTARLQKTRQDLERATAASASQAELVASLRADSQALEERLAQAEAEAADLRGRLSETTDQRDGLSRTLAEARSRLAPADGGTAGLAEAKAAAALSAEAFRAAFRAHSRATGDSELRAALTVAIQELRADQFLLARIIDARGVYQVRADDSLALVASRFYGDGNRWPEIHRANEHVLDDPDRLYKGTTLVVP